MRIARKPPCIYSGIVPLLNNVGIQFPQTSRGEFLSLMKWWYFCNKLFLRKLWDILIVQCWNIWMQINSKILSNIAPSTNAWKVLLKQDLGIVSLRIKDNKVQPFNTGLKTHSNFAMFPKQKELANSF